MPAQNLRLLIEGDYEGNYSKYKRDSSSCQKRLFRLVRATASAGGVSVATGAGLVAIWPCHQQSPVRTHTVQQVCGNKGN